MYSKRENPSRALSAGGRRSWPHPKLTASLLLMLATSVTSAFYMGPQASPETRKWSYENQTTWRGDYRECGKYAQSPIDIQQRNVIQNSHLRLRFYNYVQPAKFNIENTHHTIKLTPAQEPIDVFEEDGSNSMVATNGHQPGRIINGNPMRSQHRLSDQANVGSRLSQSEGSGLAHAGADVNEPEEAEFETSRHIGDHHQAASLGRNSFAHNNQRQNGNINHQSTGQEERDPQKFGGVPGIRLDWMDDGNNEFTLRDIHFHWGERKDNGSEHAIDGRRAAMEMHLVHVKEGLTSSQIGHESDAVVVIAVLIESYRKSNADFNPIVNALGRINATRKVQLIEYKSLTDLLPSNLESFYTYSGSLTTPPCYQVVNWVVMTDRLYLNAKQIEMFRNLYAAPNHQVGYHQQSHDLEPLTPNVRALQPLNNRTILASFAPFGRMVAWPNGNGVLVGASNSAAKRFRSHGRGSTWRTAACYGAMMLACAYLS